MISKRIEGTYNETLNIFKEPQMYKGINFHPLLIKDRFHVERMERVFGYPKTYFSKKDPLLFKLSYLKYLLIIIQMSYDNRNEEIDLSEEVEILLKHITKAEDVAIEVLSMDEDFLKMILQIKIDGVSFSEEEFSDLREIILEQNGISLKYIEDYNPELEEDLKFLNRNQSQDYSFKDQVFAFAAILGKTIEEIKDCTVYEMKNLLESTTNLLMYKMQVIPLTHVGEEYKFIPYMAKIGSRGRYDSVLMDVDKFKEESSYFKSDLDIARKK